MGNLLIGSYGARIDNGGRIKIPEKFRAAIENQFGREIFVTSLTDTSVQIYPLPVWESLVGNTRRGFLHLKPDLKRFILRVNLKGTHCELDSKGRVLISQTLRDKAQLNDAVEVIGLNDHIEVWNKDVVERFIEDNPLTDDDYESIVRITNRENE